ncbi:hypothetical protein ACNO8X_19490 [Mycobacterium sp. PDNC021]|uniref:hypothetical protein n=1 Tax=Mycobacterium sp. PDNC021 TaxID=3391399 RepID=UPI003AABD01D
MRLIIAAVIPEWDDQATSNCEAHKENDSMSGRAEYRMLEKSADALVLSKPGTIRWASGHPNGPRSATWEVIGAATKDDVYLGARAMMGTMKLSLHESNVWRLALTQPVAQKYLKPGEDSLITRYTPTAPLAPGWHYAARICTPSTTFGPAFAESRPKDRQPIIFVKSPYELLHLEYHVLLGDSDAPMVKMRYTRTVGRMTLTSGKQVLITASLRKMSAAVQQFISAARSAGQVPAGAHGWAAGDGDGVPFFVDVSVP